MNARTPRLLVLFACLTPHALARQDAPPPPGPAIPAAQEGAPDALAKSPRHGEYVDIALEGSAAPLKTWVVYPERKEKAPVVLVIHEIFGLTDWIRAVADQLAAEGFIAVAPDFLSGMGPDGGGTSALKPEEVRERIRALKPEDVSARLNAAKDWALKQPAAAQSFACIGFCWGGSQTFHYATAQPALATAVVYYGTAPTDPGALGAIACPVLGLYGGDDARVTSTVEATSQAMQAAGKVYGPIIFDGAGHGFLRQQDGREGANEKAARQGWAETIAWLKKQLR